MEIPLADIIHVGMVLCLHSDDQKIIEGIVCGIECDDEDSPEIACLEVDGGYRVVQIAGIYVLRPTMH